MKKLIKNIRHLIQVREERIDKVSGAEMQNLPLLEDAWLLIEDGLICAFGRMSEDMPEAEVQIDVEGSSVIPGWVDSHTHVVFAGDRSSEFEMRIRGMSYEEIASKGGGIINSALLLRNTSEDELYAAAYGRLDGMMAMGTVAAEIKSGYGLSMESELKMLRVIRRLQADHPMLIRSTFLGAHAIPPEYRENREGYISQLIEKMLPAISNEKLADFIDVFCEKNYFTVEEMQKLLDAGWKYGLEPKVHVNQFNNLGAVGVAVQMKARSVDHLEVISNEDINALLGSSTIPVALPGCSLFIGIPYIPARQIIDAGLPLALATDFNPGSSPSGNMNLAISLACIQMKMTPAEAINAATINGAYSMNLHEELGSISHGKRASFILTKPINGIASLPYSFGQHQVKEVWIDGEVRILNKSLPNN
ncbi:MAG: imidazolonepropionase [Flavobacteriales bacterium]|nr:imidazolonepropionase [Flavobacteriales bacterium]